MGDSGTTNQQRSMLGAAVTWSARIQVPLEAMVRTHGKALITRKGSPGKAETLKGKEAPWPGGLEGAEKPMQ